MRTDATFSHIGVLWAIAGDADLDSAMSLEFRRLGESAWRPGAPAVRAYPTLRVDDSPLGLNYWAASALFLEADQAYELRLILTDPDGGGTVQQVSAATRGELGANPAGQQRYVVPGSGGGDGSPGNPFKGLQAAADAAAPGDVFHIAAGSYSPFQVLTSGNPGNPIVFLGPDQGEAVLDGAGTDRGLVTLGEYDQTIGYIIVQGLTLQNGHWGVDAQHSHDIALLRNLIREVDDGVVNRRGDALEYNQTVCDNVIEGRTPWPQTQGQIPSEQGIDLKGSGNVVCHNRVRYFGDCISVEPSTGPSYGNDIYGNDASYCVDDGIEIDYNQANVRVWRNRVMNSRMGVSVQPIRGGPAYIFRNEFFNLESNPIKMHNYTTGYWVVHNTGAKHSDGQGDDGAMWRNAVFRDNLFLGTRYAFEFTTVPDEGFRDFDYDAWGTTRADGSPSDPYFKWNNVRYDRLVDLRAIGVETHGAEALFTHLIYALLPASWDTAVPPGTRDLRLASGAPEIDAGAILPNLSDPFVSDGQPDMGAFEYGEVLPAYGPRAIGPVLPMYLPLIMRNGSAGAARRFAPARLADPPPPNEPSVDARVYLPFLTRSSLGETRRVNAPYFSGSIPFVQTAVFWFGRVNPSENYTDVRVGYNDETLYISTNTIDRLLWYDTTPSASDLTRWDSVTLYLNTSGNTGGAPGLSSYRFEAQLSNGLEDDSRYELSARGDGGGWTAQTIDFYSRAGWRGEALNNNNDDKGWSMNFRIPFASLGLAGPPAQGSRWGLALALHDRDDSSGTPLADKLWPPAMNPDAPGTWGQLGFGLPVYTAPPVSPAGAVTIRHRLDGATVQDAGVGGYTLCGGSTNYWTQWGDTPESFYNPEHDVFNVANEADISHYPCFSKYYVAFPLDAIPAGKNILSATLTMHLFGNAGAPGQAQRSLMQVLTVNDDWNEAGLTWNNAPLAWENVSQAWVDPVLSFPGWPGVPWTWDVSYAVAQAYSSGQHLNLAVYSADGAQHSGKYFSSSDTGDWNAVARPTLVVVWGE